tara:strand:- start:89 stop:1228 length:1140 start_codon:yes stop_codon:yes gene_type:complete
MMRTASVLMAGLRDRLLQGDVVSQEGKTFLLCSGICCYRRYYAGDEADTERALVWKTVSLLFVLIVLSEGPLVDAPVGDTSSGDEESMFSDTIEGAYLKHGTGVERTQEGRLLDAWKQSSASDSAFGLSGAHASSMGTQLRSDAEISRATLHEGRALSVIATVEELSDLAMVFFRVSGSAAMNSMIQQREADFVTLESAGVLTSSLENREELLSAIVAAAESESGQAVLRDLILSFKLPRSAIGVRRTLLLTREANTIVTMQHAEILNGAHEAAMRGAEWSWEKDDDQVHKAAALLAGYAVVVSKSQEFIRKGDAFRGRICLPFLECRPPKDGRQARLVMLSEGEWAIFKMNSSGQPRVLLKQSGFGGLCMCLLFLSKS